ncbi:MAG: alpha/beta fold hydrolase [Flavobacteriales bacterium]
MKKFSLNSLFGLESGSTLQGLEVAYHTIGHPNSDQSNVVWICHALTANSNPEEWWNGLVGENKFYNPNEHYIICADVIGSCYGNTGPTSIHIGIHTITCGTIWNARNRWFHSCTRMKSIRLIGSAWGGFQAMEWAIQRS